MVWCRVLGISGFSHLFVIQLLRGWEWMGKGGAGRVDRVFTCAADASARLWFSSGDRFSKMSRYAKEVPLALLRCLFPSLASTLLPTLSPSSFYFPPPLPTIPNCCLTPIYIIFRHVVKTCSIQERERFRNTWLSLSSILSNRCIWLCVWQMFSWRSWL